MSENTPFKDYREQSRSKQWGTHDGMTDQTINVGSMLRIADACEKMAMNHDALLRGKKGAEDSRDYWQAEAGRMSRRISSLRGVITKLKKQK